MGAKPQKQKVSNISENNIDVIGMAKLDYEICIEIFFVRGSKMIGREHYFFNELDGMEEKEILSGFIKQYYLDNFNIFSNLYIHFSNITGSQVPPAVKKAPPIFPYQPL